MRNDLEKHDVRVIALSKDTVQDAAFHRQRDGIGLPLLCDPDLEVIRQYGLEHHKALEVSTGRFTIAGIPLALVPSIKTMAIPTSVLIDEQGVIRWIDQTDDYRLRSSNERVMAAVKSAFDSC